MDISAANQDLLNIATQILETIKKHTHENMTGEQIELWFAAVLISCWIALQTGEKLLSAVVSIIEKLGKLGLSYVSGREKKQEIRKRQQFCTVLRSDLDAIAKAESWNDQLFTDLEAEVEAEGSYYSSPLARLLGKKSAGIRRAPSLIKAIHTSTERCMLLVGEPGSGKSVALRHLARDLAEDGCNSHIEKITIPLYINLKELPICDASNLNANFIKQFVLDHIRRGDSDTADYVRSHWENYKDQGVWFFLFDSFDEIPAVLHAPNGSPIIAQHSQALRQFMSGMGTCRSVLASREFKGPEALPWEKLRILPLKQQRQDEMIDNTFLSDEYKDVVRQHLVTVSNSIFGNPLFLSLLCRFVGDNHTSPANDHDLLIRHIKKLTQRDSDYIHRLYGFSPDLLLQGATNLAVLFAEKPELSLAPRYDEIISAFSAEHQSFPIDLERLMSALIDVKIGRCDVKEARAGDHRFTFSHRRYQETLFVQYLAKHPQHIPARQLLLDSRWREFTVTLIQTQNNDIIGTFANEATALINEFNHTCIPITTRQASSAPLHYYDWKNSPLLHLLSLLNEGFSRRLIDTPQPLRKAISEKLTPCWTEGDLYDKLIVVRYGCLLPSEEYIKIIEWAINSQIDLFRQASFTNAKFLGKLTDNIKTWVCQRFADETMVADNKIELHKLDALSERLPHEVGASIIFTRCCTIRKWFYSSIPARIMGEYWLLNLRGAHFLSRFFTNESPFTETLITQKVSTATNNALITCIYGNTLLWWYIIKHEAHNKLLLTIPASTIAILSTFMMIRVLFRDEPSPLWPATIIRRASASITSRKNKTSIILAATVCVMLALPALATSLFGYEFFIDMFTIIFLTLIITASIYALIKKRKWKSRLLNIKSSTTNPSFFSITQQANSIDELLYWCQNNPKDLLMDTHSIRASLRYILDHFYPSLPDENKTLPNTKHIVFRRLTNFLLRKLEA